MKKLLIIAIIISFSFIVMIKLKESNNLPIIAIANYGPHSSLNDTISGIKQELALQGYQENENIIFKILDVGFDTSLIPQMITTLKSYKPKVMVVLTTPVAQFAKNSVKDIPLVFADITDPVSAGLLIEENKIDKNMTGASERQDLILLLDFIKQILPNSARVGILYSTAEANDQALLEMMNKAANEKNMKVVSVAIDQPRDIQMRIQNFKNKIDFIYVGTSGAIQPTLPVIIAEADKMKIPILNADSAAVKQNQVLASFGVNYQQIGVNAGKLVVGILNNGDILPPIYPSANDHIAFISKVRAVESNVTNIPKNTIIVE